MTTARLDCKGAMHSRIHAASQVSLDTAMVQTCPGAKLPCGRPRFSTPGKTFGSASAWNTSEYTTRTGAPKEIRTSRSRPFGVSPSSEYHAEESTFSENRCSKRRRWRSRCSDHPPKSAPSTAAASVTHSTQLIPTSKQSPPADPSPGGHTERRSP